MGVTGVDGRDVFCFVGPRKKRRRLTWEAVWSSWSSSPLDSWPLRSECVEALTRSFNDLLLRLWSSPP